MRHRALAAVIVTLGLVTAPVVAGAHDTLPFGHACAPQAGVRFCPTVDVADRVPSFDGTPIDVDVTMPAHGKGPFPAIVMIHGWGTDKTQFEATTATPGGYDNVSFAKRGYLVVNLSMRGFGRSCGKYQGVDYRTSPGCEKGWLHLADHRYEARDVQHLLGLLLDEGLIRRSVATTGGSYGGILSLELAYLRDRIRLPDGRFARWRSPGGRPMQFAAAWATVPGSDIVSALTPNGRFLSDRPWTGWLSRFPIGVPQQSVTTGLYLAGQILGFVAPAGADPDADVSTWYGALMAGEPWPPEVRAYADEIFRYHGASSIPGRPAPLLLQSGWTDDVFPARESLRPYVTLRERFGRHFPVSLQLGDVGHTRGSNRANAVDFLREEGVAFIDHWMLGRPGGPKPGAVTAFTQTCPAPTPAEGPFHATSFDRLADGAIHFGGDDTRTIPSTGGDPALGEAFDPVFGTGDACKTVPAQVPPGTATYDRTSPGILMLGLPEVRARIQTTGDGGMIAARLWHVLPDGQMRLVSRGIYRLEDDQTGWIRFELNGNGYRFPAGDTIRMELAPNDAPHYRKSNLPFSVDVSDVRITLPTRSEHGGHGHHWGHRSRPKAHHRD